MRAKLVNDSGQIKEVKVGYSWTTFFFGLFVPLVRWDLRNFLIQFMIAIAFTGANFLIPGVPVVIQMIYNITYFSSQSNKMYTKSLLKKGYRPASDMDAQVLRSKGYPDSAEAEANGTNE